MKMSLTVRLLVTGTGTVSAELLGLTSSGVGHKKGAVVLDKDVLDLLL